MTLKNTQILSAAPGMHVDGNGLYLNVSSKSGKSWIFRYQLSSKRREMGLGSLVGLSAPEASAKVAQLKVLVANGIDPLAERATKLLEVKALALVQKADQERLQKTFRAAAESHVANHSPS